MKPITIYSLSAYRTKDGKVPYNEWFLRLDKTTQAIIDARVGRVTRGLLGDCKTVDGVFELRIDAGPGYRVYFGIVNRVVVLLLCGGDKSTQKKDIKKARKYWDNYRSDHGKEK